MKIAFTNDIWNRLYGPYGNRPVNAQLRTLSEKWDDSVAQKLFWEELHHQDEVYPATFASLPWLVDLLPLDGTASEELHLFLSHVIHCACTEGGTGCDGAGPRGKYRGISTKIADHQHSWIPQREWLTPQDQPTLINLEQWFSANHLAIARQCLSLVSSAAPVVSAYAIEGFATACGGTKVAWSAQMFANGESVDFICKELGPYDEFDTMTVAKLFAVIHKRSPELTSFLLSYPGCTFVPNAH